MIRALLVFCLSIISATACAQTYLQRLTLKGQSSAPSAPPPGRYTLWMENSDPAFPSLNLLASGGVGVAIVTSSVILSTAAGDIGIFGNTSQNNGANYDNEYVFLQSTTAATVGTPVQAGPGIRQGGRAYDGSSSQVLGSRLTLDATDAGGATFKTRWQLRLRRAGATDTALYAFYDGTHAWVQSKVVQVGDAVANRPTCDSTLRGGLFVEQSTAGVGDIVQACMKGTADTYAWRTVFTAP